MKSIAYILRRVNLLICRKSDVPSYAAVSKSRPTLTKFAGSYMEKPIIPKYETTICGTCSNYVKLYISKYCYMSCYRGQFLLGHRIAMSPLWEWSQPNTPTPDKGSSPCWAPYCYVTEIGVFQSCPSENCSIQHDM